MPVTQICGKIWLCKILLECVASCYTMLSVIIVLRYVNLYRRPSCRFVIHISLRDNVVAGVWCMFKVNK